MLVGLLAACGGDAMPNELVATPVDAARTSVPATTLKPSTTSKPTAKPKATPRATAKPATAVYYKNCDAVRAAGKAPLHRGDPGYRAGLDRDKDGVACE